MSADLGQAGSAGPLSVAQAWTTPGTGFAAVACTASSLSPAADVAAAGTESPWAKMALAGMAGRAIGGIVHTGPEVPPGATDRAHLVPLSMQPGGNAAKLGELAELLESGILTEEEFNEPQKRRLLI